MKLYVKSILILVAITVVGVGGYFAWNQFMHPSKAEAKAKAEQPSIDDLINNSIDVDPVTTNFSDGGYIKAQFKLITNSQKNADEIKKLPFRLEDTIIQTINQMKKEDAVGPNGFTLIENNVKNDLNKALGKTYFTRVYLVDKLIQ
ncbi:flagellar basal body-associated FliL family protein [Bacillus sp. BRMEA1]|uniref:flagellar basal body-associated FliL family protein n=1 Tax=Neobacillus endophyticus TaxID=2738405 RepID=UPI001566EC3B|nr:flagellar basal body-associated FliL family protein [Neobacillus endophyticus]NRD79375.1 flagellar basal body-associated FliL family protein [Neobacillus endophyticus]